MPPISDQLDLSCTGLSHTDGDGFDRPSGETTTTKPAAWTANPDGSSEQRLVWWDVSDWIEPDEARSLERITNPQDVTAGHMVYVEFDDSRWYPGEVVANLGQNRVQLIWCDNY